MSDSSDPGARAEKETASPPPKLVPRRDSTAVDAIEPKTGGVWQLQVSVDVRKWAARRGPGTARELIETVRATLKSPTAIFRGLRNFDDDAEDEWLCYVSVPTHAYDHRTGIRKSEPWQGQVFCVYVRMPERMVYNWNWVRADPANRKLPEDHQDRFKERVL